MSHIDESINGVPLLLVRPTDAAKLLAVSPRKLWELTKQGEIKAVRDGRLVRYDVSDLREWIESHKKEHP